MTMDEAALSNEQLVERFQNGDDRVFSLLIERTLPMVRYETSRVRCNRADSDDLAQEALLGVLSAAQKYHPEKGASFATFSRVCVRNRLLNAAAMLMSPETPHEDDRLYDEMDKEPDQSTDPGEWLLNKEADTAFLKRLKAALSDLEYRVLMFHLAAYSYEEIAASLGISPKAVDNALQRMRRKLSQLL